MKHTKLKHRHVADQDKENVEAVLTSKIRETIDGVRQRRSAQISKGRRERVPSAGRHANVHAHSISSDVSRQLLIVGIGASAGGLDAFTRLLKHLSTETGMAFVLVQHLDPTHQSSLAEILSKATTMSVQTVKNGTSIKPNHVYVIPPNTNMSIRQGRLKLMPRSATNGLHMPIDYFLRSLASDRKNMAIGVILSGTGSDGTLAMEAIKSEGGITFAQDERSAKFADMPRNAAATTHVDFVFSPERIARKLALLAPHLLTSSAARPEAAEPHEKNPRLDEIFRIIRSATGIDFSQYKHSTLQRRIERRLALHKIEKLSEYIKYLRAKPDEVKALSQEFLIPVTNFFRDPSAFKALKTTVFPRLLHNRHSDAPLRIWVPGCSTGQEAYSLAICLHEFLGKQSAAIPIQIFASDISEAALEKARAGNYVENIALDVSPKRLKKFFTKAGNTYRVAKAIRDLCVFAKQNAAQDPPFSQLDFISCRNLLIYFTPELQKKVFSTFHYSLKPTGFLMLGKSETVGACTDLFGLVNKKARIYVRKGASSRAHRQFSTPIPEGQRSLRPHSAVRQGDAKNVLTFQEEADRITLARFAPAGVIINEDMEILEFRGDTSPYLKPAPGKASLHLLKMAREGLIVELHSAIKHVLKKNGTMHREGIRMSDTNHVSFEVLPLPASSRERHFLILFQRTPVVSNKREKNKKQKESSESQLIGQLEQELSVARDYLQSITREHEIANEELQTANEEVLSSNEEFQSTNEELETSKEELQSTNEELSTVNEELQNRNTEMTELNRDLTFSKEYIEAIFKTVREPLLVLDSELRVQMANQTFYRTFKVEAETTIKHLIYDLGNDQWNIPELRRLLEHIIPENTHFEDFRVVHMFPEIGRKVMLLNARTIEPQNSSAARLILLAIEDITEKEAKEERTHLQILEDMLANIPMAGLAISVKQGTLRVNEQLCMLFNLDPSRHKGRQLTLPDIIDKLREQVVQPEDYDKKLEDIWRMTTPLLGQEVRLKDERILLCDYAPVFHANVHAGHILLYRDVTRERRIDSTKSEFMSLASHQLRTPLTSIRWTMGRLGKSMATKVSGQEGKLLEEGRSAAARMSDTIDTMLEIARIESEEVETDVSRIVLRPFLKKVIAEELGEEVMRKRHISLVCSTHIFMHTDAKLLKEVLSNLISNALKYTPEGGKIIVRARKRNNEKIIEVQDSGYGIPTHQHKKIFQKFFRGENIVGKDTEGTGLGLYLVLLITNLLGGKISFVSKEGKRSGSTFTFCLPLAPSR